MASTIAKMRAVDPAMVDAARRLPTVAAKLATARGRTPGLTVAARVSNITMGRADSASAGAMVQAFGTWRASSQFRIWSSRSLSVRKEEAGEDAAVEEPAEMRSCACFIQSR